MSQPDWMPQSYTVKLKQDGSGTTIKRDLNASDIGSAIGVGIGLLSELNARAGYSLAKEYISQFEQAFNCGDYQGAYDAGTKLANLSAREAKIVGQWKQAAAMRCLGRVLEAISLLTSTLAQLDDMSTVDNADAIQAAVYHERGRCYQTVARHGEAVKDFSQAIRLDPGAIHFYRRGVSLYELTNYEQALDDLCNAVKREPGEAGFYVARAAVYEMLGHQESAIADYRTAVRADSASLSAYANWAALLSSQGNDVQALALLDEAIAVNPSASELIVARVQCNSRLGNDQQVLADEARLAKFSAAAAAAAAAAKAATAVQESAARTTYLTKRFWAFIGLTMYILVPYFIILAFFGYLAYLEHHSYLVYFSYFIPVAILSTPILALGLLLTAGAKKASTEAKKEGVDIPHAMSAVITQRLVLIATLLLVWGVALASILISRSRIM